MRKKITVLVAAVAMAFAVALPAAARPAGAGGPGIPEGIQCQLNGVNTLLSLGLLDDVARDSLTVNIGSADGAEASFTLSHVLALHRNSPELFRTGGSVYVLGSEATWCDR